MNIWTDGSCLGNPGPGAWAFYVPEMHYHAVGGELHTTNNRMELTALLKALNYAAWYRENVTIWSDSLWTIYCADKRWKAQIHLDLFEQVWAMLSDLRQNQIVTLRHVTAHSVSPQNNLVDSLAHQEAERIKRNSVQAYTSTLDSKE